MYDVDLNTTPEDGREADAVEVEEFSTKYEAFSRARELLEDGEHGRVSVRDGPGNVPCWRTSDVEVGLFWRIKDHEVKSRQAVGFLYRSTPRRALPIEQDLKKLTGI